MTIFKKTILSLILVVLFASPLVGSLQYANAQTTTPPNNGDALKTGIGCTNLTNFSVESCLVALFYDFAYKIPAMLLSWSSGIFNTMAAMTISSSIYSKSTFITSGWRITRDIANILFILILLYIALALVLDIEVGHASPKKMLVSLILVALLINFSLFITEVIIDASNVLALLFYTQISVKQVDPSTGQTIIYHPTVIAPATDPQEINLSGGIVQAFRPQELSDPDFLRRFSSDTYDNTALNKIGYTGTGAVIGQVLIPIPGVGAGVGALAGYITSWIVSKNNTLDPGWALLFIVACGIIFIIAAYAFFIAALSFLGRMIGLWIAIIFAPLAFITYIVPSMRTIPGFGWTEWWKNLIKMAFAAPIFMFFIYLITLLAQSDWISKTFDVKNSASTSGVVLLIFIPVLMISALMIKATKYAKDASGEIGGMVFGAAKFVGGAALGLAAGGAAFGLSRTLGAIGRNVDQKNRDMAAGVITSDVRKKYTGKTDDQIKKLPEFVRAQQAAEKKVKLARKVSQGSFDFRQTGFANTLGQAAGLNMGGLGVFSTKQSAGGYEGAIARRAKKQNDFKESLGESHERKLALEDSIEKRNNEILVQEREVSRLRSEARDFAPGTVEKKKAEAELLAATQKLSVMTKGADASRYTQADVDAGKMKIDPVTGAATTSPVTTANVGKLRRTHDDAGNGITWQPGDEGKLKANGEKVTKNDIEQERIKTESLGLNQLEKALANESKVRMNAFAHQKMVQSGYAVHGTLYDNLGNISRMGHLDVNQRGIAADMGAKDYVRAFNKSLGSNRGVLGATIGGVVAGPIGVAIAAGLVGGGGILKEALGNTRFMKEGFRLHTDILGKDKDAQAAILSGESDHHPVHNYESNYKPASGGLFDFLKSLKGSDAGHASTGGAGHGGSSGGGHGGGHH